MVLVVALVYAWLSHAPLDVLEVRFAPPAGAARVPLAAGSFGVWLRMLPLLPSGTPVALFDGRLKARQDVHAAVVDLDVGTRDLQQCADAVMRLWAEYRYGASQPIAFHPDPGKPRELRYDGPFGARGRRAFAKFLVQVMAEAGTASLAAELNPVSSSEIAPGDVLVQGGYPGHAVLVLDVAVDANGHRFLLLGQSYMPAQQFHVLKNPSSPTSAWYRADALDGNGLQTPEWPRPFTARDLRRF